MKIVVFCTVTPCSSEKALRFGGTHHVHQACRLLIFGFLTFPVTPNHRPFRTTQHNNPEDLVLKIRFAQKTLIFGNKISTFVRIRLVISD